MEGGKTEGTGLCKAKTSGAGSLKTDLLSCQGGRAGAGKGEGGDSLELACALEERSGDGSSMRRVKNIPKIAKPEPKPAG